MRKIGLILLILVFTSISVYAHAEDNFSDTKQIIDSNVSCSDLSNDQLEEIGEYYMEQMHPGEAHELMHKMMGLTEGSETEKQFHVNIAKTMYCGEGGMMGGSGGMMGMMNMMGGNMMGSGGMMGMMNMMGFGGTMGYTFFGVYSILLFLLLLGLVVLVYLWIVKVWKDLNKKK